MKTCNEYQNLSRRTVLKRGAVAGAGIATMPAWLPQLAFAQGSSDRDVLIIVQLGGGMDGLSMCVPFGDPNYYVHRQSEAVPRPDDVGQFKAINLNGFFGMHPAMQPLLDVYQDQKLLFAHATGSSKGQFSRSHFDATRWLELGKPDDLSISTGWMGRHLASMPAMITNSPIRGISMTYGLMDTLRGGPSTLPIPYPDSYGFEGWYPDKTEMVNWINSTYATAVDPLKSAAQNTVATVALLDAIDFEGYSPSGGAQYVPDSNLGYSLKSSAAIMKANLGVETIMVEYGNWDTHTYQGTRDGFWAEHARELALNLKAFYTDLVSAGFTKFTLVVLSEFGRTVKQNESGTDHGYGNAMLFMGGKVLGGRVIADWPGLAESQLQDNQDLKVTIDYRDFLGEIMRKRLKNNNLGVVFPNYTVTERNIVSAM